jgi:signal peptidase II
MPLFLNKKRTMLFVVVLIIFVDRLFKQISLFGYFEKPINILGSYFQLFFVPNPNIAFSLPLSGTFLEIFIFFLIIFLIILFVYYKSKKGFIFSICLFEIIVGAASNLFDRIKYGYVIDYLDIKYFSVFNLADSLIVAGTMFLAYLTLKEQREIKK